MNNKQKYKEFCEKNGSVPIFSQYWWLDSVSDDWDVILCEKNNNIIASMPFISKKLFIFNISVMPKLTKNLGPYITYPDDQKYESKLSYEKEILNELINKLPNYSFFFQNFNYGITNWLPFCWAGFKQTTAYSYRLEDISNLDLLFKNFKSSIRREIRKAEKQVNILESDDLERFYRLNKLTFERQNKKIPYKLELVEKVDNACKERNCRRIWIAADNQGRDHASIYIIWDKNTAYYLMGGGEPDLRTSGATSLLMWNAIKFASTVTKSFDFEGSMIEPVERFFRSFGAVQTPYFKIYKFNSKLFNLIYFLREFAK